MHRVIFHLDMDAFYASVEQRDEPSLRGKPVIVGAPPTQRGVVCAASYEARRIFVRPRMDAYKQESREIMRLVAETGATVEQMSIDEAYIDCSALCQAEDGDTMLRQALPLAQNLKQRIRAARQLTATIGIASNKKPDGLTLIAEHDKVQFLRPLPVRALYGVGKKTEEILNKAGIDTIGSMQDYPGDLRALVGSFGPVLKRYAFGEDNRALELGDEIKSISNEETFLHDTEDRKILRRCLREQAADLSERMKRRRLGAHTVQVKLRYGDFTTLTRQISVEESITESNEIYRLACFLLGREKLVSRPLRLLGLGVSNLREPSGQQLAFL